MYVSVILARFWGLLCIILSLSFLANQSMVRSILRSLKDEGICLMSGIAALVFGIFHILIHNVWEKDWRLVVTLLGWTVFLKGVFRFFFPGTVAGAANTLLNRHLFPFLLLSVLCLGAYLFYIGYFL